MLIVAETLGELILEEMQKRGMSQRQFADYVGVTHPTIGRLINSSESDPPNPSLEFFIKLSRATGASLMSLILLANPDIADTLDISPESRLMAERIENLPADKRQMAEAFILGLFFQDTNKSK